MDYSRPELADRLAAEYVSGLLRGPARRRFEQLIGAHPMLRGAVRDWNDRLLPLTLTIEPVAPPASVWQRVESRIGGATPKAGAEPGWFARLNFWRGLTAFATIAAVGLGVLLSNPGPAQAPIVVVLSAAGAVPGAVTPASFVASISGDGRAVVTRPLTAVSVQADRALELWALPPKGSPRSLGVISSQADTKVLKKGVLTDTAALAVTLEPAGGSPTGAPTGPVLYVGKLVL